MTPQLKPLLQYLTRRAETMRRLGKPAHEAKFARWRADVKALQDAAAARTCDGCAYKGEVTVRCASCNRAGRIDRWTAKYD